MAGNFGGNVFGGGSSIGFGGFLDDIFGETEDVAGDTTSATTGTPKTTDATVIPGTAGPKAKQSPGALPKFGTCPSDMIDDPLNPANFCVPKPGKNFACPVGQIYDYPKQGCVPMTGGDTMVGANGLVVGTACPYGTKKVGQACVSLVGTGTPTGGGAKTPTATDPGGITNPNINAVGGSSVPSWAIALGAFGVVAIVGGAVYAKSKEKKGGRRR